MEACLNRCNGILAENEEIKDSESEYLYLYGLIKKQDTNLEIKGLRDKPIKKMDFRDITALISFYPALNPLLKEEEAMRYAEVLKEIAKKTTVIPMAFGTVFKDKEILEAVLSKSAKIIKKTLELIENKIELGVKVIKKQLDDIPQEIGQEILGSLNKLSIKNANGDNFSERLLLNCSFLVDEANFSKFSEEIARLEKEHQNLKFVYTGPWPPYSFIDIKIKGD